MKGLRVIKDFDYDMVNRFIRDTTPETKVYVGCDSNKRRKKVRFVTVVVVHFDGRKGAKMFHQVEIMDRRMPFRERLWQEVVLAANCAMNIAEGVGNRDFEVHLDLNSNPAYRSNEIVKAAVGYINSLQFVAKTKPESWVASHCADWLTKKNRWEAA